MYHQIALFFAIDFGILIPLYGLKSLLPKNLTEDVDLPLGDRP